MGSLSQYQFKKSQQRYLIGSAWVLLPLALSTMASGPNNEMAAPMGTLQWTGGKSNLLGEGGPSPETERRDGE